MKKIRTLLLGIAAAIMVALVVKQYGHHESVPVTVPVSKPVAKLAEPMATAEHPVAETAPIVEAPNEAVRLVEPKKIEVTKAEKPAGKANWSQQAPKAKEPIQDPDARLALSMVGAAPDAEQYWMAAINDPSLPPNERKDLIEDLNEDGLSDPKHPGPQDLPIILNRLALIDELAPYAIDVVNADAFAEARKDLLDMLDGKPVN